MRLVDVVNQARRRASEGANFVRYPFQMISQALWRVGQQHYENIQLPGGEKKQAGDRTESPVETLPTPVYPGIRSPLIPTISPTIHSTIAPETSLKSRWNSYTIGRCFAAAGNTRLYEGKTRSNEPVLIKEYQLLDADKDTIEVRQQAFERLIELNQKIGHGPDFRIVKLIDAIALPKERNCYLVTKPINHNTTLEIYLSQHGLMRAEQIREVLRQVLESLRFLHTAYRVHFPSGESERGLPHGNLSLESLLIRQVDNQTNLDRLFFIYLSDLELWEHLFYPLASPRFHAKIAKSSQDLGSVQQDLADLGAIALRLAGGTLRASEKSEQQIFCDLNDAPLLHFIEQLFGIRSPFNTVEEALHTLLQLPDPAQAPVVSSAANVPVESRKSSRSGLILAIAFALALMGLIAWLISRNLFPRFRDSPTFLFGNTPEISKIADVQTAPMSLSYVVEPEGIWYSAMARQLTSNPVMGANASPKNLVEAIEERHPNLAIVPSEAADQDVDVIDQLRSGKADVAFMSEPEISLADLGLEKQTVAYDALVIFVPFSDPYHFNQIDAIQEINRSISLDELRQLYTSDVVNDSVTVPFPGKNFQARLFFSDNEEIVQRFKSQILNNNAELIQRFDRLRVKAKQRDAQAAASDRAPADVYNRIWADANRPDNQGMIGIGFDRLGQMFDQCSVYPLAIRNGGQTAEVLIRSNGSAIDRNTDLCGEKGSYFPNIQNYPLTYKLDLVYRQGSTAGNALTKMLQTTEGQYLMSEVGLIPMQTVPELLNIIWGTSDD